MIVTRFQIYCDQDHGVPVFWPEDGAIDGAILTPHEARADARKAGWGRANDGAGLVDLCPDCLRDHARSRLRKIRNKNAQPVAE